jgi:hypothetical protein
MYKLKYTMLPAFIIILFLNLPLDASHKGTYPV